MNIFTFVVSLHFGFSLMSFSLFASESLAAKVSPKDPRIGKGEIRLGFQKPFSGPVQIGQNIVIPLIVAYRNLPTPSRIYVHLLTLAGDQWITPGGAKLSAKGVDFHYSGTFTNKDMSIFNIASSNYPISRVISKEFIASLLGNGDESIIEAVCAGKEGYELTLAFLTSVASGSNGLEDVTLGLTVPDYPYYYDAILIVPIVLFHDEDGTQTIYFTNKNDNDQMTAIRLPVQPNRLSILKEEKSKEFDEIPGQALCTDYSPRNKALTIAKSNKLEVRIRYENIKPGTAIYVAMIPNSSDKYIFGSFSVTNIKLASKPTFIDGVSKLFRIPAENKPIYVPGIGVASLEAAYIATIKDGGEGEVSGPITFTPPPYPLKYEWIHLVPVLLVPTDVGLRAVIDDQRIKGPKIRVSENLGGR
jgi:hypothetical protein